MSATITVKIKNIDKIQATFNKFPVKMTMEISKAIQRILVRIENSAKRNAPVNKQGGGGNLRQSIRGRMTGVASGIVEVMASYGIYVHEGTRPHVIRIRHKRVLANKRTKQIFGKVVHHPGTQANPFLQRAVDENSNFINAEFIKAVDNALK